MNLSKGFPAPADSHVFIPPAGMYGNAAAQGSKCTHTTNFSRFVQSSAIAALPCLAEHQE